MLRGTLRQRLSDSAHASHHAAAIATLSAVERGERGCAAVAAAMWRMAAVSEREREPVPDHHEDHQSRLNLVQ